MKKKKIQFNNKTCYFVHLGEIGEFNLSNIFFRIVNKMIMKIKKVLIFNSHSIINSKPPQNFFSEYTSIIFVVVFFLH